MGAMNCSRSGCGSPMCDIYISAVGYVCYSCRREFEEWLEKKELKPETEKEIEEALKKFMDTEKGGASDEKISINDYFKKHDK